MLSHLTRGAFRFPMSVSRFRILSYAVVAFFLLPVLAVCAPARAQAQDQAQQNQSSSSSVSVPEPPQQETSESRRSFESRRQQTKQRREAEAVTETYTHRWEVYGGGAYMRFRPGPDIHNSGVGAWTLGLTRYFTPRFGITADARGMYGNNSLGAVGGAQGCCILYNAKFSVFPFTIGPQYRFYGSPKWSISGAVQAGAVYGYFDADTGPFPPALVGFYPAGIVPGGIVSVDVDYNLSPGLAVRFAPHVLFDHFGGNIDHNQGLLVGVVYRFGRQ